MAFFDIKYGRRVKLPVLVETENIMKELNGKRYNNVNNERVKKAKKELDAVAGVGQVKRNDLDTIRNLFDLLAAFFQDTSDRTSRDKMEIFLKYSNEAFQEVKKGMRVESEKDQLPDSASSNNSSKGSHKNYKSNKHLDYSDENLSKKVATLARSVHQNSSHYSETDTVSKVSHSSHRNTPISKRILTLESRETSSTEPNLGKFNKSATPDPKMNSSYSRFFDVPKRNLRDENNEDKKNTKVANNARKRKKLLEQTKHPVLYEESSKERIDEQQQEDKPVSELDFNKNDKTKNLTFADHKQDKRDKTVWSEGDNDDNSVKSDVSNGKPISGIQFETQYAVESSERQKDGQGSEMLKYDFNSKTDTNGLDTREREKPSSGLSFKKAPNRMKLKQGNHVQFLSDEERSNRKTSTNKSTNTKQTTRENSSHRMSTRVIVSARKTRQQQQSTSSRGQRNVDSIKAQRDNKIISKNKSKSYMMNQTARELTIAKTSLQNNEHINWFHSASVGTQCDGTGMGEEQTVAKQAQSSTGLEDATEGTEHLRLEIRILKKENAELRDSKEELLTRLSQTAREKLMNGNPRITDLNDKNRLTKLAEQFSELYDNEWTDAFQELSETAGTEEDIISTLLRIVMFAYQFCEKCAKGQMANIETVVRREILFPNGSKDDVGIGQFDTVKLDEVSYPLKVLRKQFGQVSLHKMKQMIIRQIGKSIVSSVNENNKLYLYTERCVELTWLMCIQDPPMHLYLGQARTPHNDIFRSYKKSGTILEYFVWPCVYLHEGGPLMSKGVAQMTDN